MVNLYLYKNSDIGAEGLVRCGLQRIHQKDVSTGFCGLHYVRQHGKDCELEMTTGETQNLMQWPRTLEEAEGRILYALNSYQIIETSLKAYLCRFSENASDPSSKYTKEKVNKLALGPLIVEFKRVNTNGSLHETLDAIKEERNEIAHQALVAQKTGIAEILGIDIMNIERLRQIDRRASRAMTDMLCEFIRTQPKNEKP
jgi:hypothetical protein